ncbi:MAG: hypothetical protein UT09_C0007G0034 [Parcubacteria group bacterium GW2011_GWF2_38_8]|nr:MAG: hypothetical protein UT09_C0007G0034 [Parcubacteria group bacterium GW2011_GWF2_38_8]
MVNQNQLLKEKFRASEQKANNRFRLQNPISISGGFYHAVATPKLTCALIGFGVAKAEAPISEPSESSDKIYLILWFESRRVFGVINKLLVGNIFHSKLLQVDLVHKKFQICFDIYHYVHDFIITHTFSIPQLHWISLF